MTQKQKIFLLPYRGGQPLSDPAVLLENFNAFALYSQWEMTDKKWEIWNRVNKS